MNTKRHNRVLFLTTLSVYMGLVLVGSPPQVLAQVLAETSSPHIKFELNRTKLGAQVSFEKVQLEKAPHFSEYFGGSFLAKERTFNTKDLFENTSAPAENDQNFVVTRLPRGSL